MAESTATEANFTFALGEAWQIPFEATDADGERIAPGDIDRVEFRLERRGLRLLTLTLGDGVAEDGNSPPNFLITVAPADQHGLGDGVYDYSAWVFLDDVDETPSRQAFGTIHAQG